MMEYGLSLWPKTQGLGQEDTALLAGPPPLLLGIITLTEWRETTE